MKHLLARSAIAVLVGGLVSPVFAQDDGVAELEARIKALEEAAAAADSDSSFSVGANSNVSLYGFVRAEAFYDFDTEQGDLTRTGRIGESAFETSSEFETSVRVSRFGIRSATPSGIGDIKTQLEFDLFSGSDQTSSPNPRLRHANITIDDKWLFGQTWTNFMPIAHYPRTADFNGPVGIAFARVPQVRYTFKAGGLAISSSLEEANGAGSNDPVLTAAALYNADSISARAAFLVGSFEGDDGSDITTSGLVLSGVYNLAKGTKLGASFTVGQGLGNQLVGGGAQSVGNEGNDSVSFTAHGTHNLSKKLSVGVAYGFADYDELTVTGDNDFDQLQNVFFNAFYSPVPKLTLAGEYIIGNRDGSSGSDSANRIGTSVTYSF